mmetsp:Transcript_35722/g.93795  ORF Transcript_35722/g.93795 Transcript_35722/m.93795 type:complete len:213 (-) Transcript_35722:2170-2808(-)
MWLRMNWMHAERSACENSYGMLKPSAPNLRRSCTIVCIKASAKSIVFHLGSVTESSMSWLSHVYVLRTPSMMPAGASFVNLIESCSMPIGNSGCGSAVTHSRKAGRMQPGLASSILGSPLTHSMHSPMKLRPRWQFCSSTQRPSAMPIASSRRAAGSWPWPIEIDSTRFLRFLARSWILPVGSEPVERMVIIGTKHEASSCTAARSSGCTSR